MHIDFDHRTSVCEMYDDPSMDADAMTEEPDCEPDTEREEMLDFAQDDGHYTYGMEDRGHEEALFGDC